MDRELATGTRNYSNPLAVSPVSSKANLYLELADFDLAFLFN